MPSKKEAPVAPKLVARPVKTAQDLENEYLRQLELAIENH
jgi:hypothetical protein